MQHGPSRPYTMVLDRLLRLDWAPDRAIGPLMRAERRGRQSGSPAAFGF